MDYKPLGGYHEFRVVVVADIKIDGAGDLVCLELNPQGQFLFVEGLTGMDLTSTFCGFLRREALAAAHAVR